MCLYVYVCVCVYQKVREQLADLVLSFHHMVPRDQTQAFSLSDKHLYSGAILPAPQDISSKHLESAITACQTCALSQWELEGEQTSAL